MSTSDSWCSPFEVAVPLEQFFRGPVGTDPCSNSRSLIKARRVYTAGGLHLPWGDGSEKFDDGYENPPYSKTALWVDKSLVELESQRINELVKLVMASTSTAWWVKAMTHEHKHVRIPRVIFTKRLAFIDPRPRTVRDRSARGKKTPSARFEPALIYYGRRVRAFENEFRTITSWTVWGR